MRRTLVVDGKKPCSRCREVKALSEFPKRERGREGTHTTCKSCNNAYLRAWRKRNPDANSFWYRKKLGVDRAMFDRLRQEQGGVCAICKETPKAKFRGDSFQVDHDHATGKVRGLLCNTCNRGIGLLKDSPIVLRAAADYVQRHSEAATLSDLRKVG